MTPRTLLALALALTACDGGKPPPASETPNKTPPAGGETKTPAPTPAGLSGSSRLFVTTLPGAPTGGSSPGVT